MKQVLILCLAVFVLAGCNTLDGLGKDLRKGGQEIEKVIR